MKNQLDKKGLTLIELLAVIAIIAILFVLLIPQINNAIEKSRETGVLNDFRDFERNFRSAFMEKGDRVIIQDMEKYIEQSLKRTSVGTSVKLSPFGTKYKIDFLDNDVAFVTTSDKKGNEYWQYIYRYKGQIFSHADGFSFSDKNNTFVKKSGDFSYISLGDEYVVIVGFHGSNPIIEIPSSINDLPVKGIGYHTFGKAPNHGRSKGSTLTEVVFPDTLEWISDGAFGYNNITNLILPNNLKHIGVQAFRNNAMVSVQLPNKLSFVGSHSFYINNLTSLTIPSIVSVVDKQAFYNNPNLKTVINLSSIDNNTLKSQFNSAPIISN